MPAESLKQPALCIDELVKAYPAFFRVSNSFTQNYPALILVDKAPSSSKDHCSGSVTVKLLYGQVDTIGIVKRFFARIGDKCIFRQDPGEVVFQDILDIFD